MILSALAKYYEILSNDEDSKISPPGFSPVNISYIINLALDGELLDILYVFDLAGKGKKEREVPRKLILPAAVKRSSGVNPNILWDNSTYIFGLTEKDPLFAEPRFKAFREKNLEFLSGINTLEAQAFKAFLTRYDISDFDKNSVVQSKRDDILKATGFMTFKVTGFDRFLHQSPEVRRLISDPTSLADQEQAVGQCLVTGEIAPIELTHPSIKRVQGTQSSGGSIVSFNDRSYESYGKVKGQGLNAPVSSTATFAYTTALNYLLSSENPNPSIQIGDTTIAYWAESTNKTYENLFVQLLNPQAQSQSTNTEELGRDSPTERLILAISEKILKGKPFNLNDIEAEIDDSTTFHVLGLSPNAARISVRFYQTSSFKEIAEKLIQHHQDLYMGQQYPWSIWRIVNETVSVKAKDPSPNPLLAGALMRSALTGLPYPAALYYGIINRIRADNDDGNAQIQKINTLRAGIIKAYLLRKYRYQNINPYQEVLTMALNEESKNQAYLLGRLFAVLEKAQEEAALPAKLNSTIKDRYFTSACANPATTFPVLLRLSQHHIAKSKYGYNIERRIREIMDSLEVDQAPFPRVLSLEEQGIFILGYYHQRSNFFVPKENKEENILENQEYLISSDQD
ncbi:MAG: type I-C CRISPR-associated protein Cas8c/Csd1 [Anaerolineaceae bacterium]|nr:type I-C CRISPR-associated protein Cas8c/Csd1 [Anaerolineaceae bacterium]